MGERSGVFGTVDVTVVDASLAIDGDLLIADGADVTQGAKTDAAVTNPASSGSLVALLKGLLTRLGATVKYEAGGYETVAASQTAQTLGATGATGDYIEGLLIIPALVAAGVVTLLDGATSIPIYVGGATTALADVKPFYVPLKMTSVSGAWKITTGASVSVIGIGKFT